MYIQICHSLLFRAPINLLGDLEELLKFPQIGVNWLKATFRSLSP